ncbi:hypothetical protein CR513_42723, partial [Mucuna pruriens]
MNSSNMQFQQNMNTTIQDLKTQIGQLANTVSHLQSARSSNLPSQTIPNPSGNASALTPQQLSRSTDANSKQDTDSQVPQQDKTVPLPFPTRTGLVEINIPLLDAIKQIPKYTKFLKELCCAQEEEDERRYGSRRYSVGVDQKRRLHCRSITSTAKEMSRSQNFLCHMH